jgi:uncharacterized damage-inducible protein DinB
MQASDIRTLFDYSYAANGRILTAAARLSNDDFVAEPPLRGAGSLRATLVHILDAELGWRDGLMAGRRSETPDLDPEGFPDVTSLSAAWQDDETRMREWLATLDDAAMNAETFTGRLLWECLAHVVNHGTQHRSEAAMILTHFGQSPGDLDFTFYLRGWQPRR